MNSLIKMAFNIEFSHAPSSILCIITQTPQKKEHYKKLTNNMLKGKTENRGMLKLNTRLIESSIHCQF